MTKIDGRSKSEAARQLDESLKRLQIDCIDLVQHHEILRFEDPHRIVDQEGAQAALTNAREQGKPRYIGFTGHKDPRIHLYMLDVAREHGFTFDTVQIPLNVIDAHYRSFAQLNALLAKTSKAASRGEFELIKTSSLFDATTTNPEWLGKEPERLPRLMPT